MSDLGHILIIIFNKLSKMISRTNKLERNVYKLAKFFESSFNTVGSLPDKQFQNYPIKPVITCSTNKSIDFDVNHENIAVKTAKDMNLKIYATGSVPMHDIEIQTDTLKHEIVQNKSDTKLEVKDIVLNNSTSINQNVKRYYQQFAIYEQNLTIDNENDDI